MITLDKSVIDKQGVTAKQGVSPTRKLAAGDNIVSFFIQENSGAFFQEDGVSKFKLEKAIID